MRRLTKGAPIRAAMRAAGIDIPTLAIRTREVDPEGLGLSRSLVGHITGAGRTARDQCSDRAAQLIAGALDQEVTKLFASDFDITDESTSTSRPKTAASRLPAQLMDQRQLSDFLGKSMSWIDAQIQSARRSGELWPGLIYVGSSRRFDPHAVLDAMRGKQQAA
ncbi:hypothetical protein [Streptomyces uncialis]|uniref:hypothetical protein n=1 Tax=Streptomyces uncialis TaxID=1048205 RepID=UPI00225B59B5|nr:hypothetical protein [Streptomyces uncialis]MCX4661470.1 hypothetical protein [Streptomyces uncialis]